MSNSSSPSALSSTTNLGVSSVPTPKPIRKREKVQFSCTTCRAKKLKCDRGQPCQSCSGRGLGNSCTYVYPGAHGRAEVQQAPRNPSNRSVQKKIGQLEDLVISLMAALNASKEAEEPREHSVDTPSPRDNATGEQGPKVGGIEGDLMSKMSDTFGKINLENSGIRYVNGGHWTAILDGIAELRGHFDVENAQEQAPAPEAMDHGTEGPLLLYGCNNHATKYEILAAIPPRPVADRLVAKYFNQMDMGPVVTHGPTFLKEYEEFWKNPSSTPAMWLGVLFSIMCLAIYFQKFQNGPTGIYSTLGITQDPECLLQTYQEKAVQCLVLGKYTRSEPYTVQALLLYFAIEHFQCKDARVGPWILLGMILRIALRMGYHRDGSHDPRITPFQAEVRRRMWAVLVQLDLAISHQMGLPRMIREGLSDTMEPRNLFDDDLSEDISELPPSRPQTDLTPVLYVIAKNKNLSTYSLITDLNEYTTPPPYVEVMRLDRLLHESRKDIPQCLQLRSIQSCLADRPEKLLQRIYFDVIFHASRCMLHRRYLLPGRTNHQFKYSRNSCIESALQLLQHQSTLHEETQPGGQLYEKCRWKLSSIINHDFLVATTLLCLDLNYSLVYGPPKPEYLSEGNADLERRENIVKALQGSYRIWRLSSHSSREAQKAAEAVRVVLGKIERRDGNKDIRNSREFGSPLDVHGESVSVDTPESFQAPLYPDSPNDTSDLFTFSNEQDPTLVNSNLRTPLIDPTAMDSFGWEYWMRDFQERDMGDFLSSDYTARSFDYDFSC